MIYPIAECAANLIETAILLYFMVKRFGYRSENPRIRAALTALFFLLNFGYETLLSAVFTSEGIWILFGVLIIFGFGTALKGKWWQHLLMTVIEFISIFSVNFLTAMLMTLVLGNSCADLLLTRNAPLRLCVLFVTKLELVLVLAGILRYSKTRKAELLTVQYLITAFTILLTTVVDALIGKYVIEQEISAKIGGIIIIALIVIGLLLLLIVCMMDRVNQTKARKQILEMKLDEYEQRNAELVKWNQEIRTLKHDLKNHFLVLSEMLRSGRQEEAIAYMERASEQLRYTPDAIHTNQPVLDGVINAKRAACEQAGIDVKCYIEEALLPLDERTFCVIFGNLLDNAIEAEEKEAERRIVLSLRNEGDFVHLIVQNRIHAPVLSDGRFPATQKADRSCHGLGIPSILDTASSAGGAVRFLEKNGWLIASVLLPQKQTDCK